MADEVVEKKSSGRRVVSRSVCILLVVLALVLGGWAGYVYGKDVATSDAEKALQSQVDSLEDQLAQSKAAVGSEVQEDNAQNQQTVDALQSENATLKQTVSDQKDEIADLEQQLEDTNSAHH